MSNSPHATDAMDPGPGPEERADSGLEGSKPFSGLRGWARRLGVLVILCLSGVALSKTVFVGQVDLADGLPPITVVRSDDVAVRLLPNPEAPALFGIDRGKALYLRCRDGRPLYFGSWVGVIDGEREQIGWVYGRDVTEYAGACPQTRRENPVRLRRVQVTADSRVNVRFGPSTATLPVAKAYPDRPLWTDGRFAQIQGYKWYVVQLESGVSGWVREDLLDLGWRTLVRPASVVPALQAQDIRVTPQVSTEGGVSFSVGASYRPVGETAEMQRVVAAQLDHGAAAVLLSNMSHPTQVGSDEDGTIQVQVELYSLAYRNPTTLLEANPGEMARSLLIGDTEIARDVEEMYGPEAAVMMRAGFLLVGGPETEEFVNVTYVLSQDPEVQAQAAVLASGGIELGKVLAAATSKEAMEGHEDLRVAALNLSRHIADERQVQVERLHRLAEVELDAIRRRGLTLSDDAKQKFHGFTRAWVATGRAQVDQVPRRVSHELKAKTATWISDLQSGTRAVGTDTWELTPRDGQRIHGSVRSTMDQWYDVAETSSRSAAEEARRRGDQTRRRAERIMTQQGQELQRSLERSGEDVRRTLRRSGEDLSRKLQRSGQSIGQRIRNVRLPKIPLPGGGG